MSESTKRIIEIDVILSTDDEQTRLNKHSRNFIKMLGGFSHSSDEIVNT